MKHILNKTAIDQGSLSDARKIYQKNEIILENYLDQLLEWNQKINLVSRNVSRETVREHIVHSLIPLSLKLTHKHEKWIDAGTGGGLPGIPLAICQKDTFWRLNDNKKKKMSVVLDIVRSLDLDNVQVLPKSISLVDLQKGTGIVSKHAFKVPDLIRLLGNKPWKTILLWKGIKEAEGEIISAKKKLNCTLYEFNFSKEELFYEGKGLVLIER